MNEKGDVFYTDNSRASGMVPPRSSGCAPAPSRATRPQQVRRAPRLPGPARTQERLAHPDRAPQFPRVRPAGGGPAPRQGRQLSLRHRVRHDQGQVGSLGQPALRRRADRLAGPARNLEVVNGLYQGAVFHFLQGFEAGLVPVRMDQEDGTLFVGGTNRGWGSRGSQPFTFERVRYKGKVPFEMHDISARADGFEVTFTHPVDASSAGDGRQLLPGRLHLHLSVRLRQPRGRPDQADRQVSHRLGRRPQGASRRRRSRPRAHPPPRRGRRPQQGR
ncbi:hypothetical protein EMGBS10_12810 [Opitutia bacterium]|nr:hypothetical protein EMGBS10_12810 [Opitutae bacterium]